MYLTCKFGSLYTYRYWTTCIVIYVQMFIFPSLWVGYLKLIHHLLFYVSLENLSFIWRRHHCRWRAPKFRPMLSAFWQGGIFIVPHLLWHGTSIFPVLSEGPPPFSRCFRHSRGCWWPILTRILMGPHSFASLDTQKNAHAEVQF
jgi:hypothetical protein